MISWKDTTGNYLSSTSQLYHSEDNLMDVLFVGSSHTYCAIYPSVIWEKTGISAFDMSISGQDKNSSVHSIVEALKTQSPQMVCVDIYGMLYDGYLIEGNLYRNTLSYAISKNMVDLIKDVVPEEEDRKNFYTKWPIVHTRYRELDRFDFVPFEPSYYGRGEDLSWNTGYGDFSENAVKEQKVTPLNEENRKWLEELYQLSLDEKFELVLFIAPMFTKESDQAVFNGAKEFAEERSIPFIDFNQMRTELDLKSETDFVDAYHCNALGAVKVSGWFADWLAGEYTFADHRNDPAYSAWDMDLTWFRQMEQENRIKSTTEITEYIRAVAEGENLLTVIGLEKSMEDVAEYYGLVLEPVGIDWDAAAKGGKWIYEDGQLRKVFENDPNALPIYIPLSDTENLKICFTEDLAPGNICLNLTNYNQIYYHLSVLIYDKFTGRVVDSRGF